MTEEVWIQDITKRIKDKMYHVVLRNEDKIPYRVKDGSYLDMAKEDIYWWTNGFWGGICWLLYHATKEELYIKTAQETEIKLEENLHSYQGMDHDSGFKWLLTAVTNYRITGDEKSRNRALIAANSLAGRFNLAGNYIRAWNDNEDGNVSGWAIIDCMMNLPLLYWAYEELQDPRFLHIAKAHADMAMKVFIRKDGSAHHIVQFDPMTGEVEKTIGGQGYAQGSSWSRGQAWALYGFYLSYKHTQKQEYLDTAKKVADYFVAHIPEHGRIPVDFCQPKDCVWEDGTAAAIASCGLLELEENVEKEKKECYHHAAIQMLKALDENACWDISKDYLIEKCTAAFHHEEHNFPMMYADYFLIEAIWKLNHEEIFLW